MLIVVATGCADESDSRQFASDPRTPVEEPTRAATPVVSADSAAPQPLASPETLVDRRGAPTVVFFRADNALRSVDGVEASVVVEGDVAAFAASPGGNQVAVVVGDVSGASETTYSIHVYDASGESMQSFDDVLTTARTDSTPDLDIATPVGDSNAELPVVVDLSWAAQGGRLLLTHSAGHLVDVPLDGEPREIDTRSSIAGAFQGDWSPRGDAIGVLLRNDQGIAELALVSPEEEPSSVTVIAPVRGTLVSRDTVESFAWIANGTGVFYLEAELTDNGLRGGTIVQWDQSSNSSSIVATGGQAGPSGSVTWFLMSPDGRAILYRVALPSADELTFSGLYLRSIDTGQVYDVPVAPSVDVTDAWWVADGLLWSQLSSSQAQGRTLDILFITAEGAQTLISSYPMSTAATPVASLVEAVKPDGTPTASPNATPE